jgi:cutinase
MKLSLSTHLVLSLAATLTSALPTPEPIPDAAPAPAPELLDPALLSRGVNLETLAAFQRRSGLEKRDSTTRNDLSGPCKPVTVIFARGTVEPGNVGDLAGPEFFDALNLYLGSSNVAVQGVDYAASIPGYLEGGDPAGAATLASLTNEAASKCPATQIVLSGYRYVFPFHVYICGHGADSSQSQGAQVVHLGVRQISAAVAGRVNAVVLFGDPDNGQPLQNIPANNVDTYCLPGDLICLGAPIVLPAHLAYSVDAIPGAIFVKQRVSV